MRSAVALAILTLSFVVFVLVSVVCSGGPRQGGRTSSHAQFDSEQELADQEAAWRSARLLATAALAADAATNGRSQVAREKPGRSAQQKFDAQFEQAKQEVAEWEPSLTKQQQQALLHILRPQSSVSPRAATRAAFVST